MKQHFVTRAYLAEFTDPNSPTGHEPFLWVHEREEEAPYRRAPHKVAVKLDYYTATVDGKREDAVEEMLSQIEGKAIPVIRDLARGGDPSALGEDERQALSLFLGFLETRVPKFRKMVEKTSSDLMKMATRISAEHPKHFEHKIREAAREMGESPPKDIEALRRFVQSGKYEVTVDPLMSLQMMLAQAPKVAEFAYGFEWRVLEAPADEVFITSDTPLVRVTTEPLPAPWMGVGWLTPWMEATFPLTPSACLLISLHRPSGREQITAERVREVNWRTATFAEKEIYSSREVGTADLNRPKDWDWWAPLTDSLVPTRDDMQESRTLESPISGHGDDDPH